MSMSRLFPILFATGLALATPASADPMLDFFKGRSTATASFKAINGVNRNFTVKLNGRAYGRSLTLVEDFAFEDGVRSRKTWRFTKMGENRYTGTRGRRHRHHQCAPQWQHR
jgi:hypothetical protein